MKQHPWEVLVTQEFLYSLNLGSGNRLKGVHGSGVASGNCLGSSICIAISVFTQNIGLFGGTWQSILFRYNTLCCMDIKKKKISKNC